jgi:outer membrane lipopolysaccharide assembly protein LptE/RlpB
MKKFFKNFFLLSVTLILLAGCGYRFSPGGENISPEVRTIFIETLGNNTSEANVENIFRNALIIRFQTSSRFTLAESAGQADARLRGAISTLYTGHLSYSSADIAREDRVTAVLDLVFETRDKKEVIWSNKNFSWYADYLVDQNNPGSSDLNRKAALQKLATDSADRIFRAIMSGF